MFKSYLVVIIYAFLHIKVLCGALEINQTVGTCASLKDNLAKAISEFTLCSVNHSRPVTLCKSCLDMYMDVLGSYKNMSEVSVNGTKCLYNYINLDRLQILETQYSNSINLWNRAKCYECYLIENGIQTRNESEVTKKFQKKYDNFITCTQTTTDNETLCRYCMDDYVKLSEYYATISNANERIGLCIDLEDLMNSTWTYWSNNCCKFRRHNEYLFIGSTTGVLILTVLLYVVVQFCGEKKAPIIIQQSRFAESINRF